MVFKKNLIILLVGIIFLFSLTACNIFPPIDDDGDDGADDDVDDGENEYGNMFVSTWNTEKISTGSTKSNQIKLPLLPNGKYNFIINWGDGTKTSITDWNQTEITHTYNEPGVYKIKIEGDIIGWSFNNEGDKLKIQEIHNWGSLMLGNEGGYFNGAQNLKITAKDILNLEGTTNMSKAFRSCQELTTIPNIEKWDLSKVTDMSEMFFAAKNFNQLLNDWDVSSVTNMNYMFGYTDKFNQLLNDWNVSQVKNFGAMFSRAKEFNQPLDKWDISSAEDITYMFFEAYSFNQPLEMWDVSRITSFQWLFRDAQSFNQPINKWDTRNVNNMNEVFRGATSFNQPLNDWDVSQVTSLYGMFYGATSFNQPLDKWDTSANVFLTNTFKEATSFDQNIGSWDISSVEWMQNTFEGTKLSTENYDALLIEWSKQSNVPLKMTFNAGKSTYSEKAKEARDEVLINKYGWIILDGGMI